MDKMSNYTLFNMQMYNYNLKARRLTWSHQISKEPQKSNPLTAAKERTLTDYNTKKVSYLQS